MITLTNSQAFYCGKDRYVENQRFPPSLWKTPKGVSHFTTIHFYLSIFINIFMVYKNRNYNCRQTGIMSVVDQTLSYN